MSISYTTPLGRAYEQMVDILFRPFDVARWLVIGFACWLARFIQGGGGLSYLSGGSEWDDDAEAATALTQPGFELPELPGDALGSGFVVALVGCLVIGLPLLLLLCLWLGSRGQFIFLDNVVGRRAEIKAPWREYSTEGNSLFRFELLLLLTFLVLAAAILVLGVIAVDLTEGDTPTLGALLVLMAPLLLLGIGAAYVQLFTLHFVVPIMLRERLGAVAGWRRFLGIFRRFPGELIVYGLWVLGLSLGVAIGIVAVGVATCLLGFMVLLIPYIGTVALLPVHITFRALGPAFLAQLDSGLDLLGPAPAPPAGTDRLGESPPGAPPAGGGEHSGEPPPTPPSVPGS